MNHESVVINYGNNHDIILLFDDYLQLVPLQHKSTCRRRLIDGKWEGWKLFAASKLIKSRGIFTLCEVT